MNEIASLYSQYGHIIRVLNNFDQYIVTLNDVPIQDHSLPKNKNVLQMRFFLKDCRASVTHIQSAFGNIEYKIRFEQRGRGGGCCSSKGKDMNESKYKVNSNSTSPKKGINPDIEERVEKFRESINIELSDVERQISYTLNGVYKGEYKVENDQPQAHGNGRLYFFNGNIYQGNFMNNQKFGHGIMNYGDGSVYEGEWEKYERSGEGTMTYSDNSYYKGNWQVGMKNGEGQFFDKSGLVFIGSWRRDAKLGPFNIKFDREPKIIFRLDGISKESVEYRGSIKKKTEDGSYSFERSSRSELVIHNIGERMFERNFFIEIEFRTTADAGGLFSITDETGANRDRYFHYVDNRLIHKLANGKSWSCRNIDQFNDNKWHIWRLEVHDFLGQRVLFDRRVVGKFDYDHSDFTSKKEIHIGYSADSLAGTEHFQGEIKNIKIGTSSDWDYQGYSSMRCEFTNDLEATGTIINEFGKEFPAKFINGVLIPEDENMYEIVYKKFIKPKGMFSINIKENLRAWEASLLSLQEEKGDNGILECQFTKNMLPVIIVKKGEKIEAKLINIEKPNQPSKNTKQYVIGFTSKEYADVLVGLGSTLPPGADVTVEFVAPEVEGIHEIRMRESSDNDFEALKEWKGKDIPSESGCAYVIVCEQYF